ncbi:GNAT family N-acetyltransferase [Gulosibacter faecalis]|jgi:polar amino acid transport system permease protein|uniref:GNAT family N-acetyltransferase n=1 Tax=Gulosibacter faecalis TaxID=272240 RepID=A0ABW5UY40_9MICO|nr:GNAT family N-acetyltransferase [Gulosibacter faecalis]
MSDLLATQRFEIVEPTDARIQPVLEDLVREYDGRYGDLDGHSARDEVYRNLEVQYVVANRGAFVALFEGDEAIATGAIKHFDGDIAEFKKIWSHPDRRGQRLASRLLARLEDEARALGYTLVYLTTGPRQPEADRLYQHAGYTAHYDPEAFTVHPYTRALVEGVDASVLPDLARAQLVDFHELVAHRD